MKNNDSTNLMNSLVYDNKITLNSQELTLSMDPKFESLNDYSLKNIRGNEKSASK